MTEGTGMDTPKMSCRIRLERRGGFCKKVQGRDKSGLREGLASARSPAGQPPPARGPHGRPTGARAFARPHLRPRSWESASDWPVPSGGARRPISGGQAVGRATALLAWSRGEGDLCALRCAEIRQRVLTGVRRSPDPASYVTGPNAEGSEFASSPAPGL